MFDFEVFREYDETVFLDKRHYLEGLQPAYGKLLDRTAGLEAEVAALREVIAFEALIAVSDYCRESEYDEAQTLVYRAICTFPPTRPSYVGLLYDTAKAAQDYEARVRAEALADFLRRQSDFSQRTFGEGRRTAGVTGHIAKELDEIRIDPDDVKEWIDVILLALDGYWRHGGKPEDLLVMMEAKLAVNMARKWGPITPDAPIEHVRETEWLPEPDEGDPSQRDFWMRKAMDGQLVREEVRDSEDLDDGC